ncbi:hypothetical protein D3C73_522690 [compost metagenome]
MPVNQLLKQRHPFPDRRFVTEPDSGGPENILRQSCRCHAGVHLLQQNDFLVGRHGRRDDLLHLGNQPGHTQVIVLEPLHTGLCCVHHTQYVAHATGAADQQTRLSQYPLQHLAGPTFTQGLQQCRQFDRRDAKKRSEQCQPVKGGQHRQAARQFVVGVVAPGHIAGQVAPGFQIECQGRTNLIDGAFIGTRLRLDGEPVAVSDQVLVEQFLDIENTVELRHLAGHCILANAIDQGGKLLRRAAVQLLKLAEQANGSQGVVGDFHGPLRQSCRAIVRVDEIATDLGKVTGAQQQITFVDRQLQPTAQSQYSIDPVKTVDGMMGKLPGDITGRSGQADPLAVTGVDVGRTEYLGCRRRSRDVGGAARGEGFNRQQAGHIQCIGIDLGAEVHRVEQARCSGIVVLPVEPVGVGGADKTLGQ